MNTDFARRQMVEQQVRAWDVFDNGVLKTLKTIPREQFVPVGLESLAFADTQISLSHGEHMMTPTVEGRVLQSLCLSGDERVLEIGTGSGYLTACLATLAGTVISLDIHADFLEAAHSKLAAIDVDNVELVKMDAMQSLPDGAFDAIAVTGSLQIPDQRFVDALAPGGRLFVVVGNAPAMQAQLVRTGDHGRWESETVFETDLAPLKNGALPPQFSF